jgi:hypothetical protein
VTWRARMLCQQELNFRSEVLECCLLAAALRAGPVARRLLRVQGSSALSHLQAFGCRIQAFCAQIEQVFPVATLCERRGPFPRLVVTEEAQTPGDFLRTPDGEALAFLDGANEVGRVVELVESSGVKPSVSAGQDLYLQFFTFTDAGLVDSLVADCDVVVHYAGRHGRGNSEQARLCKTEGYAEGFRAFQEKRRPLFRG